MLVCVAYDDCIVKHIEFSSIAILVAFYQLDKFRKMEKHREMSKLMCHRADEVLDGDFYLFVHREFYLPFFIRVNAAFVLEIVLIYLIQKEHLRFWKIITAKKKRKIKTNLFIVTGMGPSLLALWALLVSGKIFL